jgi:hypothetical protein
MVISAVAPNLQARNVRGMKISSGDASILLQPAGRTISRLRHSSNSAAYWGDIPIHQDTSNDDGCSLIPRDRGLLQVFVQFRHVIPVLNTSSAKKLPPKGSWKCRCRHRSHHVMIPSVIIVCCRFICPPSGTVPHIPSTSLSLLVVFVVVAAAALIAA